MAILSIQLSSGRPIWTLSIHFEITYAGLLEGYPSRDTNERLLEHLPRRIREIYGDWPTHVLEPARTPGNVRDPLPYRPPEFLPSVWVAGQFDSGPIDRNSDASGAILIWFQDKASLLPGEDVARELQEVDWESFARGFDY